MTSHKQLIIFGFGGHARSVADIALGQNYQSLIFYDEHARLDETLFGYPASNKLPDIIESCFSARGDNLKREHDLRDALEQQWHIVTLIATTAIIGRESTVGIGSLVAHQAYVGPLALIGIGCIINTAAVIEHECIIGDYSHVAVNATLAGRVKIGQRVMIGAGAVIRDGITIGDDIVIGAGSTVTKDLHQPGIYIGSPARLMD